MTTFAPTDRTTVVLDQFEAGVVPALIEFGKALGELEADAAVFVARKSLCLFDVLRAAGAPPIGPTVLSDRILDCDLEPLREKKLVLIDDTLILGTSLGKARRRLARLTEQPEDDVLTYVFARNKDSVGEPPIVVPDRVWLDLDEQRTRTFCSSEVRAFALAPRPYIADFPFFGPVEFSDENFALLLTAIEWKAKNITSSLQHQRGVVAYTIFPSETVVAGLRRRLGDDVVRLMDVMKVRAFARTADLPSRVRFVPIVSLKPLRATDVEVLLHELAMRVMPSDGEAAALVSHVRSTAGRQRLCQWLLSCALGHRFMSDLPHEARAGIDREETDRHFGPWASELMATAGERARLLSRGSVELTPLPRLEPQPVPAEATELAAAVLERRGARVGGPPAPTGSDRRLVTDFTEVFLNMHEDREKPFRDKVRALGPQILDLSSDEMPLLRRLETGVAWSSIVEAFCERYGDAPSSDTLNTYSLVLDICNDLGIAVPVTDERDGIVFRAWRHGEDVLFGDQELGLARQAVEGALLATGRPTLQRIHLEKLLVILIHAGIAQQFLQAHHAVGGATIARIDFELKGAVPKIITAPTSRGHREQWLSDYLVERRVLAEAENKQYQLGDDAADPTEFCAADEVEASYVRSDAPGQAKALGFLLGQCLKFMDGVHDDAPLSNRELIILASCYPPRNVVSAVLAELDIFRDWLRANLKLWQSAEIRDSGVAERLKQSWRSPARGAPRGREALLSARMKYAAYLTSEHDLLRERCANYLETDALARVGPLAADQWRGFWSAIGEIVPTQEEQMVRERLPGAMSVVYECWLSVSACEVALEAALAKASGQPHDFDAACHRHVRGHAEMEEQGFKFPHAQALTERIEQVARAGPDSFEPERAWEYGLGQLPPLYNQCGTVIDQLDPLVNEYGRFASVRELDYMVWYEIVGRVAENPASDPATADAATLGEFRAMIARRLRALTDQAGRSAVLAHCWDGTIGSGDQQRSVYLAGDAARLWVKAVLDELSNCVRFCPEVRLRIVALPCRFSGQHAHLFGRDPDVRGSGYLEHLAHLLDAVKERSQEACASGTYLGLVGDELADGHVLPEGAIFDEIHDEPITRELTLTRFTTRLRGGRFAPSGRTSG